MNNTVTSQTMNSSPYSMNEISGSLLSRFEEGLQTKVTAAGDAISLGQKAAHCVHTRRAAKSWEILILYEATANIDTVR